MSRALPALWPLSRSLGGPPDAWRHAGRHPAAAGGHVQAVPLVGRSAGARSSANCSPRRRPASSPAAFPIDKTTAFRQSRALVSILKEHIGAQRRPLLVLDAAESAAAGDSLTARGAAIRGMANFASETVFAMRQTPAGELEADWDAATAFFSAASRRGRCCCSASRSSSGRVFCWKPSDAGLRFTRPAGHLAALRRLEETQPPRPSTRRSSPQRLAAVLGCPPERILDFYGMVEQVGTVLVDCEAGHKHAPAFADVLIRRPHTLAPADFGETGMIEVLSVLPTSYPGQALLTEDQGVLLGVDDCPCGRKGKLFPLRLPHRAGRSPRLRRCLRPNEGNPMSVLHITRKASRRPAIAWPRSSNRSSGNARGWRRFPWPRCWPSGTISPAACCATSGPRGSKGYVPLRLAAAVAICASCWN